MYYVVSDLHLGNPCFKKDLFLQFLHEHVIGKSKLILCGDALECWESFLGDIYKQHKDLLDIFQSTIYITGNHDETLLGVPWFDTYDSYCLPGITISHGHDFDPFNDAHSILG